MDRFSAVVRDTTKPTQKWRSHCFGLWFGTLPDLVEYGPYGLIIQTESLDNPHSMYPDISTVGSVGKPLILPLF